MRPVKDTAEKALIQVLCTMSDEDIEKAVKFHKDHLHHLYIQQKIRRIEKEGS